MILKMVYFLGAAIGIFLSTVVSGMFMDDQIDYVNLPKLNEAAAMCSETGPKYIDITGSSEGYYNETTIYCHDGRRVSLDHKYVTRYVPTESRKEEIKEPVKETKTAKKIRLEDIKLYDEAIKAAKGCKRAENRLLELTEARQGITPENYNEIMDSVMKCKSFELESQLNKGS